jgi:hypothetical protein
MATRQSLVLVAVAIWKTFHWLFSIEDRWNMRLNLVAIRHKGNSDLPLSPSPRRHIGIA